MIKRLKVDFSVATDGLQVPAKLKRRIKTAIRKTLKAEDFAYPARVSVTFCDNDYIHGLNNEYRNVDRPTDVLSFPLYDGGCFDEEECKGCAVLGDIVLSLERAAEQAEELGHSLLHEAVFLSIHSTLHLLGYDHERGPEDEEIQCAKQREIIGSMKI